MERLTNIGKTGEIWVTDNDLTRRVGQKEAVLERLRKYEDEEETGMLVRIPLPINSTVYIIKKGSWCPYGVCDSFIINIFTVADLKNKLM